MGTIRNGLQGIFAQGMLSQKFDLNNRCLNESEYNNNKYAVSSVI